MKTNNVPISETDRNIYYYLIKVSSKVCYSIQKKVPEHATSILMGIIPSVYCTLHDKTYAAVIEAYAASQKEPTCRPFIPDPQHFVREIVAALQDPEISGSFSLP